MLCGYEKKSAGYPYNHPQLNIGNQEFLNFELHNRKEKMSVYFLIQNKFQKGDI